MLRAFLTTQLLGGAGLSTGGVPLKLRGESHILFARIHSILSDGDGLRQALQWSGAAGVKPCFRHPNVLKRDSDRVGRAGCTDYVEIDCSDPRSFTPWSQEALSGAVDITLRAREQLGGRRGCRAELERMQKAFGFAFTEDSPHRQPPSHPPTPGDV